MGAYVLSILGVVVVGILIDVIMPSGSINKFIKSIYGIFVAFILINPILKIFNNAKNFELNYNNYEINTSLVSYINQLKINAMEKEIVARINEKGLNNVNIKLQANLELDNFTINSCIVNLNKLESSNKQAHSNRYKIITEIVKDIANIEEGVIIFDE